MGCVRSDKYPLAAKKSVDDRTIIEVGGKKIGADYLYVAGPCTIESEETALRIARKVKEAGADMLRGGTFKQRTSPYAFAGLGAEGIKILLEAKRITGLPVASEITDYTQMDLFSEVDILQIGERNMQNVALLAAVGESKKPVILKRGVSATVEELLLAAEYILSRGNGNVILCERGIRTFCTGTRFTLDINSVPYLKSITHLPVIVDPSHACGVREYVPSLSLAAAAVGADGVIIETHDKPDEALCDGRQSILPEKLAEIICDTDKILPTVRKNILL